MGQMYEGTDTVKLGASGKPESDIGRQSAWTPENCPTIRRELEEEREAFYKTHGRRPDRSQGRKALRERWEWVADHYSRFMEQAENDEILDIMAERCIALSEVGRYREGLNDALYVLKEGKPDAEEDRWALRLVVARCRLGLKRFSESKEEAFQCEQEASTLNLLDANVPMLGDKAKKLVLELFGLVNMEWDEYKSSDATGEESKGKGNEAFKTGDFDCAIAHYTEVLKHKPDWAVVWANRCNCHLKLGENEEALFDAFRCVDLNAGWWKVSTRKGESNPGHHTITFIAAVVLVLQIMPLPFSLRNHRPRDAADVLRTSPGP